jgi:quaternary ammonium compound-resistance protein SugE
MEWMYLSIAGLLEVIWAVALKYSDGFGKLWPSAISIVGMIGSIFFLSKALVSLPLGTAYAVWTGIGAVGTVIFGIIFFHDSMEPLRLLFIFLIITGIIGIRVVSPE